MAGARHPRRAATAGRTTVRPRRRRGIPRLDRPPEGTGRGELGRIEKAELLRLAGAAERGGGERRQLSPDPRATARCVEQPADLLGEDPAPPHPLAEARFVELPAAYSADTVQHLLLPLGEVLAQPRL